MWGEVLTAAENTPFLLAGVEAALSTRVAWRRRSVERCPRLEFVCVAMQINQLGNRGHTRRRKIKGESGAVGTMRRVESGESRACVLRLLARF
jgi:hypothetical protein